MVEPLTDRERTIVGLLGKGLTNREIADRLYLSHETVKWYNKQIYGKLGVGNRTQAAFLAKEQGLLERHPPQAAGPIGRPRHNLPSQITTFVGREKQLREISGIVRDEAARLITLTGPGGIGKTRLALGVATQVTSDFRDGIYFVDLAPVRQPGRLAVTIATSIGIESATEKSAHSLLTKFAQERHMLLLVDNFEHLLETAPLLTELLSAAPRLKFLVTSREALGAYGETDYPVPPLSLPNIDRLDGNGNGQENESVQLFAQRATSARPQFRISSENIRSISEICVRLDGLPLAIELAAARVKHLSPSDLLSHLQHTFGALKTGPVGVPDRQRTLEATIRWSYDLLDEDEQMLFAYFSVFSDGFTLGAAEHVAGDRIQIGVEDGVESLVNKNMLVHDPDDHRFSMLDTIHEFAKGRLARSAEEEASMSRHAEYFVRLAERAEPQLRGPEQEYWYSRLDADYENIRSALAWSLAGRDRALGLRIVGALADYWYYQGPIMDGLHWIELALEHLSEASPPLGAKVRDCAGSLLIRHGEVDRGSSLLWEALDISRELGDQRNTAWILVKLSFSLVGQVERYEEARALCDQGLSVLKQLNDWAGVAQALTIKGELARFQDELDIATEAYKEGIKYSRTAGDRRREGLLYANLGLAAYASGDFPESESYFQTALEIAWEVGFKHKIAIALAALAGPAGRNEDPIRGAILLGASDALRDTTGRTIEAHDQPILKSYAAAVQDLLSSEEFEAAHLRGRRMDLADAVAFALGGSAE